jgi:hypothetical protein
VSPISYDSFTTSFLQCGGYYVDALLDAKSFPNFEIPNPYSLFAEACPLLSRYGKREGGDRRKENGAGIREIVEERGERETSCYNTL